MKLKYKFEIMEMEDGYVAVPIGEDADKLHSIINLNESSYQIFEILKEETTMEKVVDALLEKYEVPVEEMDRIVRTYIQQLQKDGLLEA
ncbi:MAG: PqqD family protein [Bacillota bacterium]|nr:PqqD family protein [Bacillota bacterium]